MFSFFVASSEIPQHIPREMTLEEYNRLKQVNSRLADSYKALDRRITLGEADYCSGLREQDKTMENINKVRNVLRHFEKEMMEKHNVNSGLDDGKQLHVYESQGLGPFQRVTTK